MLRLTYGAESTNSAEGPCLMDITDTSCPETSLRMSAYNPGVVYLQHALKLSSLLRTLFIIIFKQAVG